MGPVACIRDYQKFGDGYVRLEAEWIFKARRARPGAIARSACSGRTRTGVLDLLVLHQRRQEELRQAGRSQRTCIRGAVCFEAQMDAGLAAAGVLAGREGRDALGRWSAQQEGLEPLH